MVSEIFEYPFDLAKVRLQSQLLNTTGKLTFDGPMDCLKQTWKEEGVRGLYRGFTVPLLGGMAESAALFLAYGGSQNIIRAYTKQNDELSIGQLGLASAVAGFSTSFVVTPIELVKCRLQVQMMGLHTPTRTPSTLEAAMGSKIDPPFQARSYSTHSLKSAGPLEVTSQIIRANGLRGLWIGHSATIVRDTGGTIAWFVVKECAISGAFSGAFCVVALYPIDTIKSAMQTDEDRPNRSQRTFWDTTRRMYGAHGLKGLYSGCFLTAVRAVPSSGLVFLVYDQLVAMFP
ncbi:mitochondrial carrier domain-containing protein [Flagelloscypha sp. PMI_526]|nr:mitochondrial carrier domain-containing protein [Flagelloscypha sp. PMI_526]